MTCLTYRFCAISLAASLCAGAEEVKVTVVHKVPDAAANGRSSKVPAQRIYIDPETGEIREPPVLQSTAPSARRAPSPPATVTKERDGSLTAVLGPDKLVYSVATVQPDGTISVSHGTAKETGKAKDNRK